MLSAVIDLIGWVCSVLGVTAIMSFFVAMLYALGVVVFEKLSDRRLPKLEEKQE